MGIGLREDVLDGLVNTVDSIRLLVGNLNAEFLFNGHHNFNGIQAVQSKVICEVRVGSDLASIGNLVEVLEQVHYATLDFILSEASGGRVESNGLGSDAGRELSWANSRRAADADGSRRRPDGPRNGGSQGADNGGTEHIGRWKGGTRSAGGGGLAGSCEKTGRERRAREGMAEEHWEEEAEGWSKAALELLLPQKPCRQSAPR